MANFQRIDWGPVENKIHDLGTDLILQARDERRFDRGCLVGAQIKSGPSWFNEPARDEAGEITGWWFAEADGDHFDDWVQHALPHIVVLHDLTTRVSYWVHVTAQAITSTGKGSKILVPRTQTVDSEHLDQLMAVAASHKPTISFQGTAYKAGAANIAPNRVMRYALVVPRLVAPHRNATVDRALQPEEALAMLVQARPLDRLGTTMNGDTFAIPGHDDRRDHRDWRWRFVAAVEDYLMRGVEDGLLDRVHDAPSPHTRTAAQVLYVYALLDGDRHDEVVAFLKEHLRDADSDDRHSVDRAWLLCQSAAARAAVGDTASGRHEAAEAIRLLIGDPDDVTAAALTSAAIWLLYSTADESGDNWGEVISSSDTAASWWRSQVFSFGLNDALTRTFRRSAADTAFRTSVEDVAHNRIFTAAFTASMSGELSAALGHLSALGQHHFVEGVAADDHELLWRALDELRRSGDQKALKLAARHLFYGGPIQPLKDAVQAITRQSWTHATALANLTLWEHAGELLDEARADDAVDYCLDVLHDDSAFRARNRPSFAVDIFVLQALAGLSRASSVSSRQRLIAALVSLPSGVDSFRARNWATLARMLLRSDTSHGSVSAGALRECASKQTDSGLAAVLLELAGDDEAREELRRRTNSDKSDADAAIAALGDVRDLEPAAAERALERHDAALRRTISDAERHSWGLSQSSSGHALTVLNLYWPSYARWETVLDALKHPLVAPGDKREICLTLCRGADVLPPAIRERVGEAALKLISTTPNPRPSFAPGKPLGGAPHVLAAAVGALTEQQAADALVELLCSGSAKRLDAAELVLVTDAPTATLLPLLNDPDHSIRWEASTALCRRLEQNPEDSCAVAGVARAAADSGVRVTTQIANFLGRQQVSSLSPVLRRARDELAKHPAARVRIHLSRGGSSDTL